MRSIRTSARVFAGATLCGRGAQADGKALYQKRRKKLSASRLERRSEIRI
jgi:hypothetical protein